LVPHNGNSCDCKEQLNMALRYIQKHGGFIIYLQQEGRGIGLANKIAAYALQDVGLDTVDANLHLGFAEDCREYGVVKSILEDMKVASIQLMTNNPRKVDKLAKLGVTVDRTLPMVVPATNPYNFKYLETKEKRMNHANLATLLAQDPQAVQKQMTQQQEQLNNNKNGAGTGMAPLMDLPHLAAEYVNNGTEMSANAVQVSLMTDDDVETSSTDGTTKEEAGVTAHDDGYCFGRQSVEAAITAVGRGEMVVVVDDMDRENEGDFIMAADLCTDLDMARIVRYSSGVVCIALEQDRLDKLQLPPMVTNNQDPKGTAFTVSVDATKEHGITTGISASDRSTTVQLLAKADSVASDFHRPGHVFPLRAREGGVLTRDGHTEAAVDLAKLAGRAPAGVLCEIVSEENPTEMMRLPEIKRFCQRHGFVLTSIVDLQQYRRDTENMVDAEH
jgi:3,4-dihydroxy 2-butanone 4-phosphate synthase/GTP cyclohydrolase II